VCFRLVARCYYQRCFRRVYFVTRKYLVMCLMYPCCSCLVICELVEVFGEVLAARRMRQCSVFPPSLPSTSDICFAEIW
jgi:hypothetical protein